MQSDIFRGKIEGRAHPFTCRQIVADREAGSALELALTFVRLDDLRRGSRHAEQLLVERVGCMNDLCLIHRSQVVVVCGPLSQLWLYMSRIGRNILVIRDA